MNIDTSKASEHVMLRRLLDKVRVFYSDKKNLEAFEKWRKAKKK